MIKRIKQASSVLLLSLASVVAQAGIIGPNDGFEWELRGSETNVAGHTAEAAADTGWTWATSAQWQSSGLDFLRLDDPLLIDAFEGTCDQTGDNCNAFFSDASPRAGRQAGIICLGCAEASPNLFDIFIESSSRTGSANYRVSIASPSTSVPEPASLTLLGLGLLGMGLTRRRIKQ